MQIHAKTKCYGEMLQSNPELIMAYKPWFASKRGMKPFMVGKPCSLTSATADDNLAKKELDQICCQRSDEHLSEKEPKSGFSSTRPVPTRANLLSLKSASSDSTACLTRKPWQHGSRKDRGSNQPFISILAGALSLTGSCVRQVQPCICQFPCRPFIYAV
jgi:hypothetical protein